MHMIFSSALYRSNLVLPQFCEVCFPSFYFTMATRRQFTAASFVCLECGEGCKSAGGLKLHRNTHVTLPTAHPVPSNSSHIDLDDLPYNNDSPPHSPGPEPRQSLPPQRIVPPVQDGITTERHPILDGTPCDAEGNDLPPEAPPPSWEERAADDYFPFEIRAEFEFAEFLYVREEMSAKGVDHHKDLYATIDAIQQGEIPWQSFSVKYTGLIPENGPVPVWMIETFEVWFRSPLSIFEKQLADPDFKDEMDWAPKRIFKDGKRQFVDLFSGNWVWEHADKIAADPECHGALYVPGVFGSDKTTVSSGTGNTEFYPF
ncbi:C2H2-type domain-containing protein [Mycena venus]|uniref:C2H2-type domain-containing protein n=1 Tax=Mycena venus TaxID=2733690 RepID=A0A8H6Z801_9AGAR|nr:C2H2-type domain-containing protein [Mycena venus]